MVNTDRLKSLILDRRAWTGAIVLLALAAWTALGFAVAGAAGAAVAALVCLAWPVALWNHTVLSESLSLSLFAAVLAATVNLYGRWATRRFIVWCALAVLFAFTRSTNVFMLPFLAVPFVLRGRRRAAPAYRSWLLSRPLSFEQTWGVMADNVNYPYPEYDDGMEKRAVNGAAHTVYNLIYLPWWLWILGVLAAVAGLVVVRRPTADALIVPALIAGSYVQAYVGYHGDATEMARHCILSLIGYKTALLLAVFWAYRLVRERLRAAPAPLRQTAGRKRRRGKGGR
jgi:hypothetical protein